MDALYAPLWEAVRRGEFGVVQNILRSSDRLGWSDGELADIINLALSLRHHEIARVFQLDTWSLAGIRRRDFLPPRCITIFTDSMLASCTSGRHFDIRKETEVTVNCGGYCHPETCLSSPPPHKVPPTLD